MKKVGKVLRMVFWCATGLALLATVSVATYAWFTSNRTVSTDTATSRTGTGDLTLEISSQGGGAFSPVETAAITQVNQTDMTKLMPVSTSNLQSFVTNSATVDGQARSFQLVENEANYYHGRIYLRAVGEGLPENTRLALYLDQATEAGGNIVTTTSGELLNAARLGLMFDNSTTDSVIFRLTDSINTSGGTGNTFINGANAGDGSVLSWNGSTASAVADPSVTLSSYTIQMDGNAVTLPEKPLIYMNYNQIYQLDIYFYVEGCDPDCTDDVSYDGGDLHLGFYGMMA